MIRLSFRQSLLLGFLVMVALLAWSALESWLVLEQLTVRLQRTNARALELREAVQSLAERTVDLERGARQYLILSDPAVLDHFERNASAALASLGRVENIPGGGFQELTDSWRQELARLSSSVREGKGSDDLAASLSRLAQINASLARDSRHWIDTQHTVWSDALEERRRDLTHLLVAVVIAVCLVAVALGWWLARPIAVIERAIADLGQSRFERKIAVSGPADLRRVGRRLDWLRNRLRELEAERERTLRHVSHELKTPLTALREGVALLHDEVTGPLSADQSEVVGILQHNVLTLQRQIEGLLRLNASAIEARRLVDRPVAIRKLLNETVRERELQIAARGIKVVVQAPAVTLRIDADKLRVIIDNLLSNAIDFSPERGVLRLETEVKAGRLCLSCIDQGPGVAAQDAERIFEPFVQGERNPPVPRQGSGVGLSIVRELVSAMSGEIHLVPMASGTPGAHFRVEVPCD